MVAKQGESLVLKLVGVKEFYNITRAKMISAVNCCIVVSLCATATFAVDSAIDASAVQAQPIETEVTITIVSYPEGYDPTDSSSSEPANTSETSSEPADTSATTSTEASASEGSTETSGSSSDTSGSTTTSETTKESTTATTTTKETTKETKETTKPTTKETKQEITESELYITVYATTTVNVRKGPGTDYAKVKNVFKGDAIDVVAVTSNGWYKTYNGNYVKKSLTSETKPKNTNTPSPKPKPKATNTTAPKPKATNTTAPKPKATATTAPKPSGESVKCKITFYGPQKLKDGTYSKSTASGTTCTEGRTVAADWSIFPKGTKIYIENDPLGGDGYYTVEDKGGAVKGYIIDIYAEDGESGNHKTCYRNVSVVKK